MIRLELMRVWMKDTFLNYLKDWKSSTQTREGSFTAAEREKMFLSRQTYEGFKSLSTPTSKFLLSQGFKCVLSERSMQDVIEDYFGHQRGLCEGDLTIHLHFLLGHCPISEG